MREIVLLGKGALWEEKGTIWGAPWTPLGALPQTRVIGSRSALPWSGLLHFYPILRLCQGVTKIRVRGGQMSLKWLVRPRVRAFSLRWVKAESVITHEDCSWRPYRTWTNHLSFVMPRVMCALSGR